MAKAQKEKYYVVWSGVTPGIYTSWTDCLLQVKGYKGAAYKSYPTRGAAEEAYAAGPPRRETITYTPATQVVAGGVLPANIEWNALAVDAACSGNPGKMEYRGVYLADGKEKFHYGPVLGTNNIGEFLALVHGLALLQQRGLDMPIYTDSRTAISWVRQKKCKTLLKRSAKTEALFQLIGRAENWLKTHEVKTKIIKWETAQWGEIPADFGRK